MLEKVIRDETGFILIHNQDGLKTTELVPFDEASDQIKGLFGLETEAKWGEWRQEILQSQTFLWLTRNLSNGAANMFATLQNLLFRVSSDPSLTPEISALWERISDDADIHQETKDFLADMAEKHILPQEFIDAIRGV